MSSDTENKILLLLGELKGDVQGVHEDVKRINDSIRGLNERTRSLEGTRSFQKGAIKVVAILFMGRISLGTFLYLIFR